MVLNLIGLFLILRDLIAHKPIFTNPFKKGTSVIGKKAKYVLPRYVLHSFPNRIDYLPIWRFPVIQT